MESSRYGRFCAKMNLDKAIRTLEGILKGIAIDSTVTEAELRELTRWRSEHIEFAGHHPFTEIMPRVDQALRDGTLTAEEMEDLLWLFNNMKAESQYYDSVTGDIQHLHGILHGVLADGVVTDAEIRQLAEWTNENEHLKGCYPFDELDSILTSTLRDGTIEESERESLKHFFNDFVVVGGVAPNRIGTRHLALSGVCAVCPEITFTSRNFCITGESRRAPRAQIAQKLRNLGGTVANNVTKDLDYLVVCDQGNYCWAFACYGRKVEQAVNNRKSGCRTVIAHENDLWDAFADNGM